MILTAKGIIIRGVPSIYIHSNAGGEAVIKPFTQFDVSSFGSCNLYPDAFITKTAVSLQKGDAVIFNGSIVYRETKSGFYSKGSIMKMCGITSIPIVTARYFLDNVILDDRATILLDERLRRKISKWVAPGLRYNDKAKEKFGIDTISKSGWIPMNAIVQATRKEFGAIGEYEFVESVIRLPDESGFSRMEMSDDGKFARAKYAHGVETGILPDDKYRVIPPRILLHGTTQEALPHILREGLKPRAFSTVMMTLDRTVALDVPQRYHQGKSIILEIDTTKVPHQFYMPEPNIWATASVPPEAIRVEKQ